MKQLCYDTLRQNGYAGYLLEKAPERVIQFGEGNFLRAFADDFIDRMNQSAGFDAKVVLVQPTGKSPRSQALAEAFRRQQGLYTLYLRGFADGRPTVQKRVISCVSRCLNPLRDYDAILACAENPQLRFILCNTTEAGIRCDIPCGPADHPPEAFPAKLAQFLYRRFVSSGGGPGSGFVLLPCELIDDNGRRLRECVESYARQWELGAEFLRWLDRENAFCSTLVDRIVTGYPAAEAEALARENGYTDALLDTGEPYGFWAIEGPDWLERELPLARAGLPVVFTPHCAVYKRRKVRILNGAHTALCLGAWLAGQRIVRDCLEDGVIRGFLERALFQEILPTFPSPRQEAEDFARAVLERFQNPYIDHELLSIALNSTSKWRARVLPTLSDYLDQTGRLPRCLAASLAFYIAFYRPVRRTPQGAMGCWQGREYPIRDEEPVLDFFLAHRQDSPAALAGAVLRNTAFWGRDLTALAGLEQAVAGYLELAETQGPRRVMEQLL